MKSSYVHTASPTPTHFPPSEGWGPCAEGDSEPCPASSQGPLPPPPQCTPFLDSQIPRAGPPDICRHSAAAPCPPHPGGSRAPQMPGKAGKVWNTTPQTPHSVNNTVKDADMTPGFPNPSWLSTHQNQISNSLLKENREERRWRMLSWKSKVLIRYTFLWPLRKGKLQEEQSLEGCFADRQQLHTILEEPCPRRCFGPEWTSL